MGFWNEREYVLFRDGHACHGRKGCKNRILNVHHIESRKVGGDAPDNPAALCEDCHSDFHTGKLKLNLKRGQSFRDAAFMGIMRWAFYNRLKEKHPDAGTAYGYTAKNTRIRNGLEKDHAVDARCTGGSPLAVPLDAIYMRKVAGKRNRQLHKAAVSKGGKRKLNQSPKYAFGFQLFGRVQMPDGRKGFIFGRRSSGSFDVRKLDGAKLSAGISCKKLKPLEKRKTILTERIMRLLPMPKGGGIRRITTEMTINLALLSTRFTA